jgi:hypothetical protein
VLGRGGTGFDAAAAAGFATTDFGGMVTVSKVFFFSECHFVFYTHFDFSDSL